MITITISLLGPTMLYCLYGPASMFLGYEHYNSIRSDPSLCFLSRVGLPNDMNDSTAGEPTDPDDRSVV